MTTELEPAGYNLLQKLEQAGALTPTGLTLTDPNMPLSQAEAIGTLLGRMHMSVRFAIGDWLLFIEQVYPQEWSQMASVLEMDHRTVRDYMRVSERVAKSTRRPKLDWSQHRAVAALPAPEQKQWLKKAETEQMSHHALRDALRNGHAEFVQTTCRCAGGTLPSDPRPPKRVKDPEALRRFRMEHAYEPCDDCGLRVGVHVHHVIFRSQGGGDTATNLAWLCRPCHDARHGIG